MEQAETSGHLNSAARLEIVHEMIVQCAERLNNPQEGESFEDTSTCIAQRLKALDSILLDTIEGMGVEVSFWPTLDETPQRR